MPKLVLFFKKCALAALVLAIGLTAFPSTAAAAGFHDETTPPANLPADGVVPVPRKSPGTMPARDNALLERIWDRTQTAYQRQSDRLANSDEFTNKAQSLIETANQKGWDTSVVQAALNAFRAVIPVVLAAHNPGAAIIASHNGFDADGNVTDRATAVGTIKALSQVLRDTRLAMNKTGQTLREAVMAFRATHRQTQAPATQ